VLEHIVVAEKMLGRRLRPNEEVHHKDHDRANNDPDNLQVYDSHLEHWTVEHLTAFTLREMRRPHGGARHRHRAKARPRNDLYRVEAVQGHHRGQLHQVRHWRPQYWRMSHSERAGARREVRVGCRSRLE
jgi:hypothetical protein